MLTLFLFLNLHLNAKCEQTYVPKDASYSVIVKN
jgi:hypothetical protein